MKLIVGLGNPGLMYAVTRHNAGFMVAEQLKQECGPGGWRLKCKSLVAVVHLQGKQVIIAKPQTYMNNSGEAVRPLMNWYGLDETRLLVVCDDLDLPLGEIRIRKKGGDGGHRGLKSIIGALGSNAFARVRIGIGRPENPEVDPVQWVLGKFTTQEMPVITETIDRAVRAVQMAVLEGLDKAMNCFN